MRRALIVTAALLTVGPAAAQPTTKVACASKAEQAQALRAAGRLHEARERLLYCAKPMCPKVVRDDCTTWLAEVDATAPSLVFVVRDRDGADLVEVTVSLDGDAVVERLDGRAVPVDPGEHRLRFEAPGMVPVEQTILVTERQWARPVEVVLDRVPPPTAAATTPSASSAPRPRPDLASAGPPIAPWVFVGVGVAGLAAFGVLQGVGRSAYADLETGCGATRTCTDEDLDPVRTQFVGSAVGLGVGGAALLTAAILFVVDAATGDPAPVAGRARLAF